MKDWMVGMILEVSWSRASRRGSPRVWKRLGGAVWLCHCLQIVLICFVVVVRAVVELVGLCGMDDIPVGVWVLGSLGAVGYWWLGSRVRCWRWHLVLGSVRLRILLIGKTGLRIALVTTWTSAQEMERRMKRKE